ncbi:OsmC family protein [Aestuariimicrobium soli]|uniref:OsmC family protein n=1 Tax=Aestuariimicrobium soli TaxID=2035834 RepID=UPI003EC01563
MSDNPDSNRRSIDLARLESGRYRATNARGGSLDFGSGGTAEFTPVELLLAAIAGCSAVDVDLVTSRRAEPTTFAVTVDAEKGKDETGGARLSDVQVSFRVEFGDDEASRQAAGLVDRLIKLSHEKDCTVSRTVELPTEVTFRRES